MKRRLQAFSGVSGQCTDLGVSVSWLVSLIILCVGKDLQQSPPEELFPPPPSKQCMVPACQNGTTL